jgi:hypothetical protein
MVGLALSRTFRRLWPATPVTLMIGDATLHSAALPKRRVYFVLSKPPDREAAR